MASGFAASRATANDWADRFPAIVEAAHRIKARSFLIDGEAVVARDDGTPDFHALRETEHHAGPRVGMGRRRSPCLARLTSRG